MKGTAIHITNINSRHVLFTRKKSATTAATTTAHPIAEGTTVK